MKDLQKWWILISFMFLMNHAFAQTNSSTELFAKNPENIFLGALVRKSSINEATHEVLNTSADSVVILPSELMLDYRRFSGGKNAFNEAIKLMLKDSEPSRYSSGSGGYAEYNIQDYEQLNRFFGQSMPFDEVFFTQGKNLATKTNFLVVVDVAFTSFNIDIMDFYEKDKKVFDGHDTDEFGYVSIVTYGRKAMLLVESNLGRADVSRAVKDAMENEGKLSEESQMVLDNSNIRVATFGQSYHENNINEDPFFVLKQFLNALVTITDFENPISFYLLNYDGSNFRNEYP